MALHIPINNVNSESGAIQLIQSAHFVAVSFGAANGLPYCASEADYINKLYWSESPLGICVRTVTDVQKWAILSLGLLSSLLHGPIITLLRTLLVVYCAP